MNINTNERSALLEFLSQTGIQIKTNEDWNLATKCFDFGRHLDEILSEEAEDKPTKDHSDIKLKDNQKIEGDSLITTFHDGWQIIEYIGS